MTTSLHQTLMQNSTDEELVCCLKSGDPRQFARVYDYFSAPVYGMLLKWIKDPSTAENFLQDVFVKAWRCRHLYSEEKGRLFTWLYRIARNSCIDYFRSKSCKRERLCLYNADAPEMLNKAAEGYAVLPDAIGLRKLVNNLRQEERELVDMMYFKGMTQRQIAEMTGLPIGTVKTRMSKAIKELRYYFKSDWKQAMKTISLN